jgi:hypothetical protein
VDQEDEILVGKTARESQASESHWTEPQNSRKAGGERVFNRQRAICIENLDHQCNIRQSDRGKQQDAETSENSLPHPFGFTNKNVFMNYPLNRRSNHEHGLKVVSSYFSLAEKMRRG